MILGLVSGPTRRTIGKDLRHPPEVPPYAVVAYSELPRIDEFGIDDFPVVDPDPWALRGMVFEDMLMIPADPLICDKHEILRRYCDAQLLANFSTGGKPRIFAPPKETAGKRIARAIGVADHQQLPAMP